MNLVHSFPLVVFLCSYCSNSLTLLANYLVWERFQCQMRHVCVGTSCAGVKKKSTGRRNVFFPASLPILWPSIFCQLRSCSKHFFNRYKSSDSASGKCAPLKRLGAVVECNPQYKQSHSSTLADEQEGSLRAVRQVETAPAQPQDRLICIEGKTKKKMHNRTSVVESYAGLDWLD